MYFCSFGMHTGFCYGRIVIVLVSYLFPAGWFFHRFYQVYLVGRVVYMNSLDGSLFRQIFLCIFYFLSSMLHALWVLYIVIRSGPGAEFLLVIFITYFMSSSVKYMLLGLVSVFSRIIVISFSTSFLKVLSWLLLSYWCYVVLVFLIF